MIRFNPNMEAAPRDRRILALRADGGSIGIVKWEPQRYHKNPNPYWSDDRERSLGIGWCRENPPIAWAELQAAAVCLTTRKEPPPCP